MFSVIAALFLRQLRAYARRDSVAVCTSELNPVGLDKSVLERRIETYAIYPHEPDGSCGSKICRPEHGRVKVVRLAKVACSQRRSHGYPAGSETWTVAYLDRSICRVVFVRVGVFPSLSQVSACEFIAGTCSSILASADPKLAHSVVSRHGWADAFPVSRADFGPSRLPPVARA